MTYLLERHPPNALEWNSGNRLIHSFVAGVALDRWGIAGVLGQSFKVGLMSAGTIDKETQRLFEYL